ncbi:MAG: class I tRNA ligase family protein [Patescibacteria group bacterium]|nr:class I tRNA ligase family protein [Patescibacteria group bacterium]MCL5257743.1 class I tRNA ligase family protein [Patescibacteria group bacterium]
MFKNLNELEKKILKFWQSADIFEQSVKKRKGKKLFVFLEGPPTANGLPHTGHFLTRIYKDTILRFRTMKGDYAPRRAGWDTHGLPVEVEIEKKLGFKNKRDIVAYGVDKFIQKCKESVLFYKKDWEREDERMGFWIDHTHPYITYTYPYIESLWSILKKIYQQKLLIEENRVEPYCPRCATTLSQAEVGQVDAYKKVFDPSLWLKLKLKDREDEFVLVWTTTPWTLPANAALAVKPDLDYHLYQTDQGKIWSLRLPSQAEAEPIRIAKAKELIGLIYEPLYPNLNKQNRAIYKIYAADFLDANEGSGIVHIAPAFGKDDFELSQKHNLPPINPINENGCFELDQPKDLADRINGLFFKSADPIIIKDLEQRNLIFPAEPKEFKHDYPHCWRCHSPLIYYLSKNWVIKLSRVNKKLLANNDKINWIPAEIKNRFGQWLKEGKDWNLSRKRFWGTPLPIWRCDRCAQETVVGSLKELAVHFKAQNEYYFLRHGQALSNLKKIISSYPETFFNPLTRSGINQVKKTLAQIKKTKIDLVVSSPLRRCRQTAQIIAAELGLNKVIEFDLREIDTGKFNGGPVRDYENLFQNALDQYEKKPVNGENLEEVKRRTVKVVLELEKKYRGKKILLVSHQDPIRVLTAALTGQTNEQTIKEKKLNLGLAEFKKTNFLVLPRNEAGEIDLNRPFVDQFSWPCPCGGEKKRVSEVADVWFDSGSAPFAANHYPFENKDQIDSGKLLPIDFIVEGVDQTRGWFNSLLAVSTLIKNKPAYRNAIGVGFVTDKNGRKLSKSLGNYVPPAELIEKYGADLVRFYLFYLSEAGDQKKFNEADLLVLKRNYFDLILNILNFYRMYETGEKNQSNRPLKKTILDKWFETFLREKTIEIYQALNQFNPNKASRVLVEVVDNFSHWWLRRSRRRFQKPKNKTELLTGLKFLSNYLFQLAIVAAPLTPFLSEFLYQEIKSDQKKSKLSVHLEDFRQPEALKLKEKIILEEMTRVRQIIADALALRKNSRLKIRQPLSDIYLAEKIKAGYIDLIKTEIQVKEIKFGQGPRNDDYCCDQSKNICLNTKITPALREEGIVNDIIRIIQSLRQEAELTPQRQIRINLIGPKQLQLIANANNKRILAETNSNNLSFNSLIPKNKKFLIEKEFDFDPFGLAKISLNL